jgi:hypothetical protein
VKYQRRTDDDRIAELAAKIEGIRVRAARANPAVKQATLARKAMERALEAQPDEPLGPALEQALAVIRPALDQTGTTTAQVEAAPEPPAPARKSRRRATTTP